MSKGEYGEPLSFDGRYLIDANGRYVTSRWDMSRLVACTNALAGCNPEKLGALIAQVNTAINLLDNVCPDNADDLEQALAEFRGAQDD